MLVVEVPAGDGDPALPPFPESLSQRLSPPALIPHGEERTHPEADLLSDFSGPASAEPVFPQARLVLHSRGRESKIWNRGLKHAGYVSAFVHPELGVLASEKRVSDAILSQCRRTWISPAKRDGTKANPLSERFSPGPRAFAIPVLSYWNTVPESRSSGFATSARAPGL